MRNNKGFSLVELIVVIAIMAILASVAVIGVSVYVPKAQKAADQQMVADIQKAIDLYAQLEGAELQPGQSGYVVIKKTGSNAAGVGAFIVMPVGAEEESPTHISVGDTIDDGKFVHDALVSYFGEDYGKDLKVTYGGWTSALKESEITAINNSTYMKDPTDILETVQTLTDAMKGYYGAGATNEDANQAVLDVAAGTQSVNKEAFVAWWMSTDFNPPDDDVFNFAEGMDGNDKLKVSLAAVYAKGKAFAMSTGCQDCQDAFNGADIEGGYFGNITSVGDAQTAIGNIMTAVDNHLTSCPKEPVTCGEHFDDYCSGSNATAKSDAEAYIALLGQIDGMSETIQGSDGFDKEGLYTSGFITDIMNTYVTEVKAYAATGATTGDIVISFVVGQDGSISFKSNLSE